MKRLLAYSALTLGVLTFALTGCDKGGSNDASGPPPTPASTDSGGDNHDGHDHEGEGHEKHDHGDHDHGKEGHDHKKEEHDHDAHDHGKDGNADASKIEANLAKLPAEDAKLAKAQKTCPVTGEALGGMGVPQKVDVNGKAVFICCKGCKGRLLKDPEKYLAKLNK